MNNIDQILPLTPLRKIIAARMQEAKQTIPHYRVSIDIKMDALLALRQQMNSENPGQKISVNDLLIKACANTLVEHPALNCQFVGDEIHQYKQADISVVMAVEGGLSTPVVRSANNKTVKAIADEVKTLGERAQKGSLKMDEILGGTFSISNLGMFDVDHFDAIINPPQCAILAVGAAKLKPIVINEVVEIGHVMRASLSLDHRVIDGSVAAQFLLALREQLQNPELI